MTQSLQGPSPLAPRTRWLEVDCDAPPAWREILDAIPDELRRGVTVRGALTDDHALSRPPADGAVARIVVEGLAPPEDGQGAGASQRQVDVRRSGDALSVRAPVGASRGSVELAVAIAARLAGRDSVPAGWVDERLAADEQDLADIAEAAGAGAALTPWPARLTRQAPEPVTLEPIAPAPVAAPAPIAHPWWAFWRR